MPSHGTSARKPPPYNWLHFGDDVCGVIEALGLERVLGVGHSMGGHAVVLAAAARPDRFRGLLLVDPVIVAPEIGALVAGGVSAESHPIRKRRNRWDSPQEMFDSFRAKEPYSRWDPRVLMDYCRYGLEPAEGGGYVLACPPDLEAEVYAGAGTSDIYALLPRVRVPVEIIRARARRPEESLFDFSASPTWDRLARAVPGRDRRATRRLLAFHPDGAPALDGGAHRACRRAHGRRHGLSDGALAVCPALRRRLGRGRPDARPRRGGLDPSRHDHDGRRQSRSRAGRGAALPRAPARAPGRPRARARACSACTSRRRATSAFARRWRACCARSAAGRWVRRTSRSPTAASRPSSCCSTCSPANSTAGGASTSCCRWCRNTSATARWD